MNTLPGERVDPRADCRDGEGDRCRRDGGDYQCSGRQVVDVSGAGPLIACGQKGIRLVQVQPEGRKVMSGVDYLHGYGLKVGSTLG